MTPEEFRALAHHLVDWMADYMAGVERYPVRAQVAPGAVLGALPQSPPAQPEPMAAVFADFERIIMPGMTHWQHPAFFAYFPANSSPPSVLAEMLTATLGAQCMSWQTSPAATELEQRMMAWLGQMIGLPAAFEGVIQDSASSASLCAILCARERASGFASNRLGLQEQPRFTIYASSEAHSSIEKDVGVAGLGRDNLRKVAVDRSHALDPAALDQAITADRAQGRAPIMVVAAIGSTGSSAIDPLKPIADICRRHGLWLHVDAAWAGSALILPEYRWMIEGIDQVDSFVFNPHKWLFTNFDCSAYFVRDSELLQRTLSILPEYLRTAEGAGVRNYRDWSVPLGRRFRALKLWFVIRSYGVDGLKAMIAEHIALAHKLAAAIDAAADFELLAATPLALVCFRHHPPGLDDEAALDQLNQTLLDRINDSGRAFLTHTRLDGRLTLRMAIGQTWTRARHVEDCWRLIQDCARGAAD